MHMMIKPIKAGDPNIASSENSDISSASQCYSKLIILRVPSLSSWNHMCSDAGANNPKCYTKNLIICCFFLCTVNLRILNIKPRLNLDFLKYYCIGPKYVNDPAKMVKMPDSLKSFKMSNTAYFLNPLDLSCAWFWEPLTTLNKLQVIVIVVIIQILPYFFSGNSSRLKFIYA